MKNYKPKPINKHFNLIPILIFILLGFIAVYHGFPLIMVLIMGVFAIVLNYTFTHLHESSIEYFILGDMLIVRGLLVSKTIPIQSIRKVEKNNNFMRTNTENATTTSFEGLEIYYNKFETILVSPTDKEQFIADLVAINPAIEVKI